MARDDFGKGSQKRHLAAIKAAETKRKKAILQEKEKRELKTSKIIKSKIHHNIASFIENELTAKLIVDLKSHLISSESDLQSSIYYHLRNYLSDYKNIRISAELPMKPKKDSKVFVDLVVSKVIHNFAQLVPLIAIELKEHKEVGADLYKDIDKLQMLRENKIIKYGFMVYLCRSNTEQRYWQEKADNYVKSELKSRIKPIIINIYDNITGTEKIEFDRRWQQTKSYDDSNATAKKAVKTRKSREESKILKK